MQKTPFFKQVLLSIGAVGSTIQVYVVLVVLVAPFSYLHCVLFLLDIFLLYTLVEILCHDES